MNIVALIPARGGSKRVKNKNIQQIKGAPLIGWAIKQAMESKYIKEIYVSTDSIVIAEVAKNYGAKVPFIRPDELAQDQSTDYDVFEHFLKWYMSEYQCYPDIIVQVRATSPLRMKDDIDQAVELLMNNEEADSVRSISLPHQTPYKMWKMGEHCELSSVISIESKRVYDGPTQSLPTIYEQDGIVDVVKSRTIIEKKSMSGTKILGYLVKSDVWDIDTTKDLNYISYIMTNNFSDDMSALPNMKGRIGIIQGRLTDSDVLQKFPKDWKREFCRAREAGYAYIELIRDRHYNVDNPLWLYDGKKEDSSINVIKDKAIEEGVAIRTICDDYVLDCSWEHITISEYQRLVELIFIANRLGANRIVYPLMEKAEIYTQSARKAFLEVIKKLSFIAKGLHIQILLEVNMSSDQILSLLDELKESHVLICVDTGNLINAGFNPVEQILQIRDKIGLIHIKDRNEHGENVPLGEGIVNFKEVFKAINECMYKKDFTIESSRGTNTLRTAKLNREAVESYGNT